MLEYTALKEKPGLMLFIDFEKAFDTVSWKFLFKTLKCFNFGENFIKWIKILYQQPQACVLNNGHATNFFTISRGIRQGCPISALLFILVAEIMSINLKRNNKIQGIQIRQKEILISQLADDTTLFLRNKDSLVETFSVLNHFHKCAGLKLNKAKTEAIVLGQGNDIDLNIYGINTVKSTIKSLGIIIGKDLKKISEHNFKDKIIKIKNLLNMWKCRQLSIKGKITIIRSQALPIILYPASILFTPTDFVEKVDKIFFDFIWPNKKHHVKKKVLIQNIEDGGLKMPDIKSMIKAIKLTWIKRLLLEDNNFTELAKVNSKISNFHEYFRHNMTSTHLYSTPTPFYCQILDNWDELRSTNTKKSINEILNEKIWFNKDILIGNKPFFNRIWCNNGITKINDLFNNHGTFKSKEELFNDFHFQINTMELNSIKSAIPKEWVKQIKLQPTEKYTPLSDFIVKINNTNKPVTKITCREFYFELIKKKVQRSKALETWEELYYYIDFDWNHIHTIPYLSASETSLQSLQYQIINRYFPCRANISTWYENEDKNCPFCNEYDTIEHYFFECKKLTMFWKKFGTWWNVKSLCSFNLGKLDIVFGIMNENNDCILSALNYCILYAKKFIHNCKLNNQPFFMNNFICKLKRRLIIEEYIAEVNNLLENFKLKWDFLYQN